MNPFLDVFPASTQLVAARAQQFPYQSLRSVADQIGINKATLIRLEKGHCNDNGVDENGEQRRRH